MRDDDAQPCVRGDEAHPVPLEHESRRAFAFRRVEHLDRVAYRPHQVKGHYVDGTSIDVLRRGKRRDRQAFSTAGQGVVTVPSVPAWTTVLSYRFFVIFMTVIRDAPET